MAFATTDLCDAHEDKLTAGTLRAFSPGLQVYGGKKAFSGPVVTLKVFEDNSCVRLLLEDPGAGNGSVLVVDGGGSLRCALLGGNLATLAVQNGWEGIIVNGCIRDVEEINACNLGVRALATHPIKSFKRGQGESSIPIVVAGVRISPGDWCYADSDGVLISSSPLARL